MMILNTMQHLAAAIDVMTKLVLKYGPQILEEPHPESYKVGQKAILLDTGTEAFEKVA